MLGAGSQFGHCGVLRPGRWRFAHRVELQAQQIGRGSCGVLRVVLNCRYIVLDQIPSGHVEIPPGAHLDGLKDP